MASQAAVPPAAKPGVFADRPTLVVTGGWNEEYEQIASRLEQRGARHLTLAGHGHRPQDHPDFNGILAEFAAASAAPS